MKLKFGRSTAPPPLVFSENWEPKRGDVRFKWLPDKEFNAELLKRGLPLTKDGFAVWDKRWWKPNTSEIWIRASSMPHGLMRHEAQHIEQRVNFHKGEDI